MAWRDTRWCGQCKHPIPDGWRHEQVPFVAGCVEVALAWMEGADGLPLRDVDGVPMLKLLRRWP